MWKNSGKALTAYHDESLADHLMGNEQIGSDTGRPDGKCLSEVV